MCIRDRGKGHGPEVVDELAAVVGPGLVVKGVDIGTLAVGGADKRDDDAATAENVIGQLDGGEEVGAKGVDVAGVGQIAGAALLDGDDAAAPVPGQE